ncbi:MAG: hypothetical protein WCP95_01675 [Actinomycetes bacterium]
MPRRLITTHVAIGLTVLAVAIAGCSSSTDTGTPASSAAAVSAVPTAAGSTVPTPSASVALTPSASASATPSATPSGAHMGEVIPATITGMHVAGVQDGAWPDRNDPFGALRLWDNGTNWSQIEAVKGQYNWKPLDAAVTNARAHGVKDILLVLGGTPTWNASRIKKTDYPGPGAASTPKSLAAWDAFVRAVVKRYAGKITSYQIWNEASLVMFWNGTPETLAKMTKSAADIIHTGDPKAKVVAASTTVRLAGSFSRFFPRYLAALGQLGWPIDVFAAHLYPSSLQTTDERAAFIATVKQAISAAGAPDKPVWDTELNYGLAGPGPSNPHQTIEGPKARDWVVQTELDSLHLGFARTYWYIWTPQPYPLLGMQLTNDSGAVEGLRIIHQWLVGSTFNGCNDDGVVVNCFVEKNGIPSIIAWAVNNTGIYTAPEGYTQVCNTANTCKPVAGPIALKETPVRIVQ